MIWRKFIDWQRRRVLAKSAIPDDLWQEAYSSLPWLERLTGDERARLRELVVLFLNDKHIVPSKNFTVTPLMRVVIAIQACVLVLNRDLSDFDAFDNIVVYPDQFITNSDYTDEAGVVHRTREARAGEAWERGPVVLSWPDVLASGEDPDAGSSVVIHEFAHKLDMRNGRADGYPEVNGQSWRKRWINALRVTYRDFVGRVDALEAAFLPHDHPAWWDLPIDPYGAESEGEFFAVSSEAFFVAPEPLRNAYPEWYACLKAFYRIDLADRAVVGSVDAGSGFRTAWAG